MTEKNDSWLNGFRGQHVTIATIGQDERADTGTLVFMGDGWLQLAKDNGELVLIPYTAVRLVKLLDMISTTPVGSVTTGTPPVRVV